MVGGLIQFEKYATQVGQYVAMGRTGYGDVTQTSITTINLLVYQEENGANQTTPNVTARTRHFAIVSKDIAVATGDHLKSVVDHLGNAVLASARIRSINDYNTFRYGSKFKRVELDVDIDG